MNAAPLDLTAIALYFVVIGIYGFYTRRTRTFTDYAVGRHSVPALMIFASLTAPIIGPGFSVGSAGEAYNLGFLFYFLCLSYTAQLIIVGLFVAPRLTAYRDCTTLGEVMRKSYGRFVHLLTGLISVGLMVGFTAVIGRVGAGMLSEIAGWPLGACLVAVTGTTALLTFTGGVRATIATEAFQFALFSFLMPVTLWFALAGGSESLADIAQRASMLTAQGTAGMSVMQMFGIVLAFMLGEALLPSYVNRALAARSPGGSRAGFMMAGGYIVIWLGIIALLGIIARGVLPPDAAPDSVLASLAQHALPTGVYGLLLAALIGIVMSSQEATLNSSSVSLVRDVVSVFVRLSGRGQLLLAKGATLALAALAIFIAQFSPSIIEGLLILYSVWAPTILLPLILALYCRRPRPLAGCLAIVSGGVASFTWQVLVLEPHGVPAILVGLVAAALGYALGHVTGRPVRTSRASLAAPA